MSVYNPLYKRMADLMKSQGYKTTEKNVRLTTDTLISFYSVAKFMAWNYERITISTIEGLDLMVIEGIQRHKRDRKRNMNIVDFGDRRAVVY